MMTNGAKSSTRGIMTRNFDNFHFDKSIPKEISKVLPVLFKQNAFLVPGWCHEVRVFWDSNPEEDGGYASDSPAYTHTNYEYRHAEVWICPTFLDHSDYDKEQIVKHELGHIITAPLVDYVHSIFGMLDLDETLEEVIKTELQRHTEAVTEDLTIALRKSDKQ